jgi:hypothetical protein
MLFFFRFCSSQNICNLENYYLNDDLFKTVNTYSKITIDGKPFKAKIFRDKFDENLRKYDEPESEFEDAAPKTLVLYSDETQRIVYVNKFYYSKISLAKLCGNLSKVGKMYLNCLSYGGGSGFSSNTNLVSFEEGKIVLTEVFNSSTLDFVLFNKNDKEIYILKGIFNHESVENAIDVETHFSNHRYQILRYRYGYNSFEQKIIGITINKYASLDDGKSAIEIFDDIIKGENFMPLITNLAEYIIFDNFGGAFIAK